MRTNKYILFEPGKLPVIAISVNAYKLPTNNYIYSNTTSCWYRPNNMSGMWNKVLYEDVPSEFKLQLLLIKDQLSHVREIDLLS